MLLHSLAEPCAQAVSTSKNGRQFWSATESEYSSFTCLRSLYPRFSLFAQDKSVLDALLRGYEAELEDAAKGDISLNLIKLFSEVKRIQNEMPVDEQPINQMVSLGAYEVTQFNSTENSAVLFSF